MQHQFISLNGEIVSAIEPHFISTNRALRYGDGMFEGFRIINGEFSFFEDHILRLFSGMKALGFVPPDCFSSAYFLKIVSELLIANKVVGNSIVRIQVYRANAGLYEPINDDVEFFIESFNPELKNYQWYNDGISVLIFEDWKKSFNPVMNFKTCNSQVYVMASRWKCVNKVDDALILNSNGNIADATSSNVFIWKENKIITPTLSEACIGGVFRKNLIAFARLNNIIVEERIVSINDVMEADELFLTNISKGIRSVETIKVKHFTNIKTKQLAEMFYSHISKGG